VKGSAAVLGRVRPRTSARVGRRQIVAAAGRHLGEAGVAQATYDSLAAVIGCSRGAILHHFPSRAELLHAVLLESAAETGAQLASVAGRIGVEAIADRASLALNDVWAVFRGSSARVTMELLLASRTDGSLAGAARQARARLDAGWAKLHRSVLGNAPASHMALVVWSIVCERLAVESSDDLPAAAGLQRMKAVLESAVTVSTDSEETQDV
jgi:AcrR family transcriptional regulator